MNWGKCFSYILIVALFEVAGGGAKAQTVDRFVIDRSTRDPVHILIQRLEAENRVVNGQRIPIVVELCEVELDLTGQSITLGSSRSLIASPNCERSPANLGPRIFVTDNRTLSKPLFAIRGDNVRISGFRIEGPTPNIGAGSASLERGILISPFECSDISSNCIEPIRNIEVSNMEIFHWSGAGVDIRDNTVHSERGRLFNATESAVRIKNNFIHHNRHGDGNGYGVEVAGGAYALITQNVFDENRHAIAGGSSDGKKDFSGYTARENLFLAGGGLHCSEHWIHAAAGWQLNCWHTHQIDMHGNKSETFLGITVYASCCGTAGETILIERNTVLYDAGNAIKIRGNPADKAVVDGNVFRGSRGDAIAQNGNSYLFGDDITKPIEVRPNNVFGSNPMAALGSCDFFGYANGQKDEFMATGNTWWAKSPVTGHWRYLNTMPERLTQVQLLDADNDGKCDVALPPPRPEVPPRRYSKSGIGPWVPFLAGNEPIR
jgi:hypothetical protein